MDHRGAQGTIWDYRGSIEQRSTKVWVTEWPTDRATDWVTDGPGPWEALASKNINRFTCKYRIYLTSTTLENLRYLTHQTPKKIWGYWIIRLERPQEKHHSDSCLSHYICESFLFMLSNNTKWKPPPQDSKYTKKKFLDKIHTANYWALCNSFCFSYIINVKILLWFSKPINQKLFAKERLDIQTK